MLPECYPIFHPFLQGEEEGLCAEAPTFSHTFGRLGGYMRLITLINPRTEPRASSLRNSPDGQYGSMYRWDRCTPWYTRGGVPCIYPGWCTLHIPGCTIPTMVYPGCTIPTMVYPGGTDTSRIPGWYRHLSDTRVVYMSPMYPGGIHASHVLGWYRHLSHTRVVPTPLTYPGGVWPPWVLFPLPYWFTWVLVPFPQGFSPVSARF